MVRCLAYHGRGFTRCNGRRDTNLFVWLRTHASIRVGNAAGDLSTSPVDFPYPRLSLDRLSLDVDQNVLAIAGACPGSLHSIELAPILDSVAKRILAVRSDGVFRHCDMADLRRARAARRSVALDNGWGRFWAVTCQLETRTNLVSNVSWRGLQSAAGNCSPNFSNRSSLHNPVRPLNCLQP